MQIFLLPLLFMLPLSSIFESSLQLRGDLRAGVIPAARQAVLNTVVTGAPCVDDLEDTSRTQKMADATLLEYDPDRLAESEAILGHRCNADQAHAVSSLMTGVSAIHGPPGTGALLS